MMFSSDTLDFGFEILLNEIEILSYLHRLLFDVIECDEPEFEEKQSDLFLYLNNIPIETNFNVYEAFIQLLVHASLIRHYYQSVFQRIISILDELLRKHNLKEVFHPLTIFNVFEKNKVLLLHLYENNIIDLSLIMNEIWAYADESLFLYFGYEIIKESPSFFEETVDYLRIRKSKYQFYYNTDKQEEFFCGRKHGHSFDKLSKIIQNDDIDSFISIYFSLKNDSNESFDLNQKIYPPACESNKDIRNFNRGISLLEYSMAFGSVKIFKYLWIHKVEYSKAS
ncbi:hypothetical protein TRFO_17326 [Tritrichomonas foetus]|uniref:DUF3447 domain-containing protein n=1 Tax=Tritrichomonas foetus TaxID=1144522 RepID=A0A1J4KTF4_9EUKA|nr:hypothetical protein TRFO_17326 [Tritrichomonas foetus]|eukprot:OHT12773.1 hypothetical protein TRFO_17326 [Tritrichomonas foetus]